MKNAFKEMRRVLLVGALVMLLLPLAACSKGAEDDGMALANISPYNHTPDYIYQLYVDGQWGGNSRAYGGGGSFVCCVAYPRTWREGLTATVRWTTSDSDPNGSPEETWHERVVPIERYEQSGTTLNVHFLPDHQLRLIIWNGVAGSEGYPGPDAPEPPPKWPPWLHEPSNGLPSSLDEQSVAPPQPPTNGGPAHSE